MPDPPTRSEWVENKVEDLLKLKGQLEEEVLQLQSAVHLWREVASRVRYPGGIGETFPAGRLLAETGEGSAGSE